MPSDSFSPLKIGLGVHSHLVLLVPRYLWGKADMPSESLGKGQALRPFRPFHVPKCAAASGLRAHKGPRHAFSLQQAVKKPLLLDSLVCLSPWLVSMLMFLIALLHSSSENPHVVSEYQNLPNFAEYLVSPAPLLHG